MYVQVVLMVLRCECQKGVWYEKVPDGGNRSLFINVVVMVQKTQLGSYDVPTPLGSTHVMAAAPRPGFFLAGSCNLWAEAFIIFLRSLSIQPFLDFVAVIICFVQAVMLKRVPSYGIVPANLGSRFEGRNR